MKKIYENAMLQVVCIKKNDIITDSQTLTIGSSYDGTHSILAPGRNDDFEVY